MGLFASSILVKYSLLNNSGSLVYAGTSSNSLRIWGAQLELAEYSEDILNDYINNYRYVRTTGQAQNFYGIRFGSGVNGDQSVDSILIGGSSGTRMNNVYAENTAFFVDKAAKRGTEIISLFTTSTSISASSSYTFTSGTNLIVSSESFATNWSINELTIDSTVNVPSPIGSYGDVKKLRENTVNGRHWIAQVQATGQNYSGVLSFYARAAERSILGVEISNFVTEAIYYLYNLSSGTISIRAPAVNDYSNVSASMTSVGSGWYRCQLFWRRNAYSAAAGNNPTFTVHDNLGAISYTGDNTSGLYLWGVQYGPQNQAIAELGYPLYIPTTSTALTNYPVSSSANLFLNSNAFTVSPWLTGNLSINTSTAVLAPNGTSPVYLATEDNNYTQHLLYQSIGTVSVGQPFTFSAYLRANTSSALRQVSLTGHAMGYPIFDLTTGVVVSTGGFSSASISAAGNGWYRCTVQGALPSTTGNFYILPWYFSNNYIGNGQSGFYVWGAQLTTSLAQQSQLITTTSAAIGFYATSSLAVTTSFSIVNTTSYNVLSTAYQSNFSGNLVTGASPDSVFVGQQYRPDTRLSGDPLERLEFNLRKRIKDTPGVDGTGATVSDDRRRIPSNPIYDAAKVAGLELVKKTTQTFSYNRYTPVSGDNVYYNANDWFSEVGRSQRARMAIGGDTQVHFFEKRLDEIKQIPQNPRFDALRVMGIEPVYKTSSIITLSKYTPVHNSDYTYYKRYDWFSEVPRSQRARSALGIGDGSPLMFDNLQFVEDFISLPTKGLFETLVTGYGSTSQTSRLAGRNDPETMKFVMLQAVKRGKDDLYIINNRHQTSSDAIQTQEIFYNKPGNIFGKKWYQLAPYFSNYSSIFDGQYGSDIVRVGDYHGGVRHSNNRQETMAIWFAPRPRAEILLTTDTTPAKIAQKTALRSSYSSTTVQTVIRTNRIAYSERLDRTGFWGTTGATVTTSTALLSPLLPYRAVGYDADQLHELFYNQPRQPQYKKWYTIVPLTARTQSWTSNAINIVSVTSSNSQHGAATLINFNVGTDNYYSYGMFVKQRVGVNRVRLYVGLPNLTTSVVDLMGGSVTYDLITDLTLPFSSDLMELGSDFEVPHYADFDLVTGTVINRLNVSYANITDRGNGWKLIKIAGPVTGTADSVTDTLPVFRDFVSIRDSLELSSALFDLAPGDLLALNGAVDLTDAGGIEELL